MKILPDDDPFRAHPDLAALDAIDNGVFGSTADHIATLPPSQRGAFVDNYDAGWRIRSRRHGGAR